MRACILVKTETGKHSSVAKKLSHMHNVRTCFPVLGQADVVVKVEVRDLQELMQSLREMLSLRSVSETETLVESGV